jgi:hypothetical protein
LNAAHARPVPGEIITWIMNGISFCATRFSVTVNRRKADRSPFTKPCPSCQTISGAGRAGSTPGET